MSVRVTPAYDPTRPEVTWRWWVAYDGEVSQGVARELADYLAETKGLVIVNGPFAHEMHGEPGWMVEFGEQS